MFSKQYIQNCIQCGSQVWLHIYFNWRYNIIASNVLQQCWNPAYWTGLLEAVLMLGIMEWQSIDFKSMGGCRTVCQNLCCRASDTCSQHYAVRILRSKCDKICTGIHIVKQTLVCEKTVITLILDTIPDHNVPTKRLKEK